MILCSMKVRNHMAIIRTCICIVAALYIMCAPRQIPLPDKTVEAYGQSAAMHFRDGRFSRALHLYKKALGEAERLDFLHLEARYVFNIGRIFYECNLFDSARQWFSESRSLFIADNSISEAALAGIFESLSIAYLGNIDSACKMFRVYKMNADPDDAVTIIRAEMMLLLLQGKSGDALSFGDSALALIKEGNNFDRGVLFNNMAMAAFVAHDYKKTSIFLDSSLLYLECAHWRFRNWKPLLGKAIISYCNNDTISGAAYYRRARKAVPDMVVFPDRSLLSKWPDAW